MASAPLLDFTTLTEAHHVRIDGETYPLRQAGEMTLGELKRLELDAPRLGALLQQETLTPDEEAETSRLLKAVCRIVLNAPDAVRDRLSDMQRIAVLEAFTQLQSPASQATGAMAAAQGRSTGANTSRASSGSTAGIRKAGSRVSRSH